MLACSDIRYKRIVCQPSIVFKQVTQALVSENIFIQCLEPPFSLNELRNNFNRCLQIL